MSTKLKIILYQMVIAIMLLATPAVTYVAIDRIDYYFNRGTLARQQLHTAISLAAHANRYSESVAELLLLGETELSDFSVARNNIEQDLDSLRTLTEREIAYVRSTEQQSGGEELARIDEMQALVTRIDWTVGRVLFLREQGQPEDAVQFFRSEIEERLDAELKAHIAATAASAQGEVQDIDARADRLKRRLGILMLLVSLTAIAISTTAGALLNRALTNPIRKLIAGTRAIGEGNLGYRVAYTVKDKLAELAQQLDITAARLEEQRDHQLQIQAGLEDEIARRTHELKEANAQLQRLDHLRLLFLADISHELRTPLTVIRGEAEVTLRGQKPLEEYRETLHRIAQQAEQMGRLVDDLLFLARTEIGAVRFEMRSICLQDALQVALQEAQILASIKSLPLRTILPPEPLLINGDPQRLIQALLIILDNAVKYSDPGAEIEVTVQCNDSEAVLAVSNKGVDIPSEELPFVFDRFYRGRCARNLTSSGSGLGLPIAKWIIDRHGGQIAISSHYGETIVRIRLPLLS